LSKVLALRENAEKNITKIKYKTTMSVARATVRSNALLYTVWVEKREYCCMCLYMTATAAAETKRDTSAETKTIT
jgi:hypothetical protein